MPDEPTQEGTILRGPLLIVDAAGNLLARIGASSDPAEPGVVSLALFSGGRLLVQVDATPEGAALQLHGPGGRFAVLLAAGEEANQAVLFSPQENVGVVLRGTADGGGIGLFDAEGQPVIGSSAAAARAAEVFAETVKRAGRPGRLPD